MESQKETKKEELQKATNLNLKAKFFALYWGQEIIKFNKETKQEGVFVLDELKIQKEIIEHTYLELKPLSNISDEDAIQIALLKNSLGDNKNKKDLLRCGEEMLEFNSVLNSLQLEHYDFLRSKGYALEYNGITVEQQIKYGWIKLKSNDTQNS